MKLADLPADDLAGSLRGDGLYVRFGPFVTRIRSNAPAVAEHLREIYPHHEVETQEFAESSITIRIDRLPQRPWVKMASLRIDDRPFMYPLRERMAVPMLEWGMNWVVASRAHQYLLCHSAVLERHGHAVMMPAVSGAGKSTLCTVLASAGWRLFSDEFAVVRPADQALLPMPRAVSLKNQSIELAKRLHPSARFTESYEHTIKGTLAFMAAPGEAIRRSEEAAPLGIIVFPKFEAGTTLEVEELPRASAFSDLVTHSMNYAALGRRGFDCTAKLIDRAQIFRLTYGDVDQAIAWFDRQAQGFE